MNNMPQNQTTPKGPATATPKQQEKKEERIKDWVAAAMIVTALLIDAVTLIPVLGSVIGIAGYFGFFVWFKLNGIVFMKSFKNIGTFGLSAIIEVFLSFLPSLTAGVIGIILIAKAEDRGGLLGKAVSMAQGKVGV